ncbi:unnamed protein product [Acanthoscelides obtectus]|uniref:Cytidyltransferase-like domain-containing protein n=1 Tax=Acanthoscelides obtectus TaxID=200917 RepID=A0A9P0JPP0_ACAOB|nr:unnamed protein product [Acanthoscelides obtectus]CAK1678751.1 hypothetical protein AOBTE_LOCUS32018 [Acanthoscelides obtectus]
MLAKTGLLIVSNPKQIHKILSSIHKQVKNTLYIQLLSALGDPLGAFQPVVFNTWPKFSKTLFNIYSQVAVHCNHLDVRVLISGLKYNIPKINTKSPIDLVIFDKTYKKSDIEQFIKGKINNITEKFEIITVDTGKAEFEEENIDEFLADHVVLGGTFDRIHVAHKFLLSEVALRSKKIATVCVKTIVLF